MSWNINMTTQMDVVSNYYATHEEHDLHDSMLTVRVCCNDDL